MGFFGSIGSILKGAVKVGAGVVRTVAPVAAGLVPGGAVALGTVSAITGGRRRPTKGSTIRPVTFVPSVAGPSFNPSTQETQPSANLLDRIRRDLERAIAGVAGSFGRDVAKGVTEGAEAGGGVPLRIRGNLPIFLGIGGIGIAAIVLAVVLTRKN